MTKVTPEDLDKVIAEFDQRMTTSVLRLTEAKSDFSVRQTPLRYHVYFKGVLMAKCTSMVIAERMKRVLLGKR